MRNKKKFNSWYLNMIKIFNFNHFLDLGFTLNFKMISKNSNVLILKKSLRN